MDYFVLIIGLLLFPVGNYADSGKIVFWDKFFKNRLDLCIQANNTTSVTSTTWFWPLLSICLALILSIPCTLITVIVLCHNKKQSDDSDESSIDSSASSSSSSSQSLSSSSSTPAQRRSMHHHHHHCHLPRSHYAGGFRSPPPPYTNGEQSETRFNDPSLPPPYESHVSENHPGSTTLQNSPTTVINVEPADTTINQSTIIQQAETTVDLSSTVTNQSIQTFQVWGELNQTFVCLPFLIITFLFSFFDWHKCAFFNEKQRMNYSWLPLI